MTPKICCSIVPASLDQLPAGVETGAEQRESTLQRTVKEHTNIITNLHRQLCTLWTKGKLVCVEGDVTAKLTDASPCAAGLEALGDCQATPEAETARLQDEVARLTENIMSLTSRLEESNHYKTAYREKLMELTGDLIEEDEEVLHQTSTIQALQRENRQLSQALQVERANIVWLRKSREASNGEAGKNRGGSDDFALDQLRQRHKDEIDQLGRAHEAETSALRVAEREQRLQAQELQRKTETLAREALRRQAEVGVLQEEIQQRTQRLVEAWSSEGQAALWDGSSPPAKALSHAELEASRREVQQLRHELLSCEAVQSGASASSSSARAASRERPAGLLQELKRHPINNGSDFDHRLSMEVERLSGLVEQLERERESVAASRDEHLRRREMNERTIKALQSQVDQAASEAMLTNSVLGKEASLRRDSYEAPNRRELSEAFFEAQPEHSQTSGDAEVDSLRSSLRARTQEVLDLKRNLQAQQQELQVEEYAKEEQAQTYRETQRRLEDLQSRQLDALRQEIRQEAQDAIGKHEEAEEILRSELKDLEDTNARMVQQNQRHFDDYSTMQERLSREMQSFRKEQAVVNQSVSQHRTAFDESPSSKSVTDLQKQVQALKAELEVSKFSPWKARTRRTTEAVLRQSTPSSLCDSSISSGPRPIEGVWGVEDLPQVRPGDAATEPLETQPQIVLEPVVLTGSRTEAPEMARQWAISRDGSPRQPGSLQVTTYAVTKPQGAVTVATRQGAAEGGEATRRTEIFSAGQRVRSTSPGDVNRESSAEPRVSAAIVQPAVRVRAGRAVPGSNRVSPGRLRVTPRPVTRQQ